MTPTTYLGFHLLFILPPVVLVVAAAYLRPAAVWGRVPFIGLGVIVALAVGYTTPWDAFLIELGVWSYGDGVVSASVYAIPIGEYLFFFLQPILVALWLYNLEIPTDGDLRLSIRTRLLGLAAGAAVAALGVGLLLSGPSTLYLGAILTWASPVLAIQWAFGWPHLFRAWRAVVAGIGAPTAYLWVLDRFAITNGLWILSDTHTLGIAPFGLPIEEAVFFLITNVFIVQGLVLYLWLVDQWPTVASDVRRAVPSALRGLLPSPDSPVAATDADEPRTDDPDRTTT
ncbi:lycopene cyclase domain-containing protein [Natronomonas sp.]|jgi:lycopene cyclase domain-containing protein|uniref:lycopene cyclase domain-containing protein n=1 Tax=Natronomonas sp. TaxID=2184060 RepID=UPI00398970CC